MDALVLRPLWPIEPTALECAHNGIAGDAWVRGSLAHLAEHVGEEASSLSRVELVPLSSSTPLPMVSAVVKVLALLLPIFMLNTDRSAKNASVLESISLNRVKGCMPPTSSTCRGPLSPLV